MIYLKQFSEHLQSLDNDLDERIHFTILSTPVHFGGVVGVEKVEQTPQLVLFFRNGSG